MFVPTVGFEHVQYLVSQAREQGCAIDGLLKELEIDIDKMKAGDGITSFKYGRLYRRIMRSTYNEWFGMLSGGKVPIGAFRMMCLTLLHCSDLREAIERGGEFAEICRGLHARYRVEYVDNLCYVKYMPTRDMSEDEFDSLQACTDPNHMLMSLIAGHRLQCWLVGQDIPVEKMTLSFGPGKTVEQPTAFCSNVEYDQKYNGIYFDTRYLEYPIIRDQDGLMEFLRTAPYHLVTVDSTQMSLTDKVHAILNRDVGRTMPSAESVADQLHMSVTTLRRHLTQEGTSYQALKDECRLEAALHYLSCLELSNTQVAERLGFDEPSAFFRAFKKWTGDTPGNFRQKLMAKDPNMQGGIQVRRFDTAAAPSA